MAERPEWVAAFEKPSGTEIKHIHGRWYLYEYSSFYDPERKRSRKKSGRMLGRITEEGLVEAGSSRRAGPGPASDIAEVGATAWLWGLTGPMRERLERAFPDIWRQVYAAALVRAQGDGRFRRLALHYEDSALSRAMPGLALSPASVTSLLRELGGRRSDIVAYMREDLAADGRYVMFDGHRIVSASSTLDNAERGYDSKRRFKPQVNLVYMFSEDGGEGPSFPAFYKQFMGSTPDVTAFGDAVAEAGAGGEGVTVVGGEGCGSADGFGLLEESGLHYVVPLQRGNSLVAGHVPASPAGYEGMFAYNGRAVHFKTLRFDGFDAHLYLDADPLAQEAADLVSRTEKANATKAARKERELARRASGKGRLTDEELAALEPVGVAEAYGDGHEQGTITIRTDRTDLGAAQAYCIYKRRQSIGQFFKTYADTMGLDSSYMRDNRSEEAWLFLNHLASAMVVASLEAIAAAGESKSVSYRDLMQTLGKIKAVRVGGEWSVPPVKKAVRQLCSKLGVDPYDLSLLGQ